MKALPFGKNLVRIGIQLSAVALMLSSFAVASSAMATPQENSRTVMHLETGSGNAIAVTINGSPVQVKTDTDITPYVKPGRNVVQLSWAHQARQIDLQLFEVLGQGTPHQIKKAHFGVNDDIGENRVSCGFQIPDQSE